MLVVWCIGVLTSVLKYFSGVNGRWMVKMVSGGRGGWIGGRIFENFLWGVVDKDFVQAMYGLKY